MKPPPRNAVLVTLAWMSGCAVVGPATADDLAPREIRPLEARRFSTGHGSHLPPHRRERALNWGQWRGPWGTGSAPPDADPPIHWNEQQNVRWKIPVVGRGHSTPIVWDDYVLLTTAEPIGEALPPRYSGAPGAHDNLPITHRHPLQYSIGLDQCR
jgi:hypothetical protein